MAFSKSIPLPRITRGSFLINLIPDKNPAGERLCHSPAGFYTMLTKVGGADQDPTRMMSSRRR